MSQLDTENAEIKKKIDDLEKRNVRVDQNKKWETSWTRRITIGFLTYITILVYLLAINNDSPYKNALVPLVGYILSTLVLNKVRILWEKLQKT